MLMDCFLIGMITMLRFYVPIWVHKMVVMKEKHLCASASDVFIDLFILAIKKVY